MSRARPQFSSFLHGAAVYPEFMPRNEWLRLLDDLADLRMNTIRLLESAWGWLEPAPGRRRHDEAIRWLDDAHARGLRCILGTGSFLPPQWLYARHPDALVLTRDQQRAHPLQRKSACLEHPAYRDAVLAHTVACADAWVGHPSVIAWQLDNEIDRVNLDWTCHCPRCETAWTDWLRARYGDVATLNQRLRLDHWGLELEAIENLPLPRIVTEIGRHPGLVSLEAHFRRERVTAFLRDQARALRDHGTTQPFSHNFFATPDFTSEEPGDTPFLDFGAYDLYLDWEPVEDSAAQLRKIRLMEQQRACHDGDFLLMETSMGTVGGQALVAPSAPPEAFRRRLLLALAAGARGILYWTGTVWRGGPWIFHGALHDYTGQRVPEWPALREFGHFLERHASAFLTVPVRHDVAVIGSHAAHALAASFPVFPGSEELGRTLESVCRRRGLAVDVLTPRQATDATLLSRYRVVVLGGEAQALGTPPLTAALLHFAEQGGTVVVAPLAGYITDEGVIPQEGLAANLSPLTGITVAAFRWFGANARIELEHRGQRHAVHRGFVEAVAGLIPPQVVVDAHLISADPAWRDRPAILRRGIGRGTVWKYLALPDALADSPVWLGLPALDPLLAEPTPADVLAVPRTDDSMILVNLSGEARVIRCAHSVCDRFTGCYAPHDFTLPAQAAAWLSRA